MNRFFASLTAVGILFAATELGAQERWGFELRVNGNVPTQEIEGRDLGAGFGFDGTLRYRFLTHLGAYAGWDWIRYSPDDSFAGADTDFEETGYVFGLRFEHPLSAEGPGGEGWAWWARAGATVDHIEIEDSGGELIADSGHGLGWEAGAGLAYGFGSAWSFTPGVRYRSLTRDVEIGAVSTDVELRYLAFEVGIARLF